MKTNTHIIHTHMYIYRGERVCFVCDDLGEGAERGKRGERKRKRRCEAE